MRQQLITNDNIGGIKGELIIELRDAKTGKIKSRDIYKNLFVTLGKQSIAQRLSGAGGSANITYCAVGTNGAGPNLSDTILGNELSRKLIAVRSSSGKVATFQTFFGTGDANGVLLEAGLFGDTATAQPASGILFCKTNINRTKTPNDTLTITWNVTIG